MSELPKNNHQFVTEQEKSWAMVVHLAAYASFLVPVIGSILAPLIIWVLKKPDMPFVNYHGKEVLNFNISFLLYYFVAALLVAIVIGYFFLGILFIAWFILTLIAAIRANEGKYFKYPLTIRFLK